MNKETKLNGPIRALFKSKAKEKLELIEKTKVSPLQKERDEILKRIVANPDVSKLVSKHKSLVAQVVAVARELQSMGLSESGSFSYHVESKHRFSGEHKRFKALKDEIEMASACKCQTGDSPEMLEFAANLSLCKTVGEAENLLAKIK